MSSGATQITKGDIELLVALNLQVDGASDQINHFMRTGEQQKTEGESASEYKFYPDNNGRKQAIKDLISTIRDGFRESRFAKVVGEGEVVKVQRGVNSHRLNEVGVADMAFLSTSVEDDQEEAISFAAKGNRDCCLYTFLLSPGTRQFDFREMAKNDAIAEHFSAIEDEILVEDGMVVTNIRELEPVEKSIRGGVKKVRNFEITLNKLKKGPFLMDKPVPQGTKKGGKRGRRRSVKRVRRRRRRTRRSV